MQLFDVPLIFSHVLSLSIAFVLALPLGWDREKQARTAGLRTFPLVAIASCGYVLIAKQTLEGNVDAQARVIQGLITGIGFVGGGAILKDAGTVRGTATAASIWSTGAIGVSAAYGRYEIGLVLSLVNFTILRLLTPLKAEVGGEHDQDEDDSRKA